MRLSSALFALLTTTSIGCGAARPAPQVTPPRPQASLSEATEATGEAPRETVEPLGKLPEACAEPGASVCTPPAAFARRLCDGSHPDVALAMFGKDTPWTRAYLRGNVEAWNAAGGRTSTSARLEFDEEVLILVRREPRSGGVQVGASGSLDVLRWDGTCASLMSDEITMKRPPKAKSAPIPWRSLDLRVRDALLADAEIERTDAERRKECRSSADPSATKRCAKADARLGIVIAEHVRNGGTVPLLDPPR